MTVPLFYDAELLTEGIKFPLGWNPATHPHILVVGGTGLGKTYALKLILGKIAKYLPDAELIICDYKNCDFAIFNGERRHYGYQKCTEGMESFYDILQGRLDGRDVTATPRILAFDEWGAFVLSQDKKQGDAHKAHLSELLMLGRSYNIHVIVGLQRADSEHFRSGSRDQFSAILGLGNLSKEQRLMLFSDYRDEMTANCGRGQGYFLLDGQPLRRVIVPTVRDMDKLHKAIYGALTL